MLIESKEKSCFLKNYTRLPLNVIANQENLNCLNGSLGGGSKACAACSDLPGEQKWCLDLLELHNPGLEVGRSSLKSSPKKMMDVAYCTRRKANRINNGNI